MNTLKVLAITATVCISLSTNLSFCAPGKPLKESVDKFITDEGKKALKIDHKRDTDNPKPESDKVNTKKQPFCWKRAILKTSIIMVACGGVYYICKLAKESNNNTIKSLLRSIDLLVLIEKARSVIK